MPDYKKPVRLIAAYRTVVGIHLDYLKQLVPYSVSYSTRCDIDEKIELILQVAEGYDSYVALFDDYKELMAGEPVESDVCEWLYDRLADTDIDSDED